MPAAVRGGSHSLVAVVPAGTNRWKPDRAAQATAGSPLQRNSVPLRQRRCRSKASLRATATLAFLKPLRTRAFAKKRAPVWRGR